MEDEGRQSSAEPEEQVDLEGYDDMDDEFERDRDDFDDPGPEEEPDVREAEDTTVQNDEMKEGGEGADNDDDDDEGSPEEKEKWAELLALPPHGSGVFIGGLPKDTTEEDLRELCEPMGEIFEVRLMKDKETKENKGYAFVTFTNAEAAKRAIDDLHDKKFKERTLRCSLSQAKHRLFVGNVPKSLSEDKLKKIIKTSGPGVENVETFKDMSDPSRNRGFMFVDYYNNACAEYSKQKLSSSDFKIDGSNLTVTWAEPKASHEPSAAAQVKTLYVKNLPENVSKEKVKELFEEHGEVTKVVLPPGKPGQKRNFGFVHFAERSAALKAVKVTEKYEIDGHELEVCLAKPQTDKKVDLSQKVPMAPTFSAYPPYGAPGGAYMGDPYGAFGGGYNQPMIYGQGPMPAGMRMVPMVLPDGRVGYVLQQPGAQVLPPPRRGDRRGGQSSSGGGSNRGNDGGRGGRRYNPY